MMIPSVVRRAVLHGAVAVVLACGIGAESPVSREKCRATGGKCLRPSFLPRCPASGRPSLPRCRLARKSCSWMRERTLDPGPRRERSSAPRLDRPGIAPRSAGVDPATEALARPRFVIVAGHPRSIPVFSTRDRSRASPDFRARSSSASSNRELPPLVVRRRDRARSRPSLRRRRERPAGPPAGRDRRMERILPRRRAAASAALFPLSLVLGRHALTATLVVLLVAAGASLRLPAPEREPPSSNPGGGGAPGPSLSSPWRQRVCPDFSPPSIFASRYGWDGLAIWAGRPSCSTTTAPSSGRSHHRVTSETSSGIRSLSRSSRRSSRGFGRPGTSEP